MIGAIRRLCQNESGVTSVEYGVLVAGIAIAVSAAVPIFSESWTEFTLKVKAVLDGVLG